MVRYGTAYSYSTSFSSKSSVITVWYGTRDCVHLFRLSLSVRTVGYSRWYHQLLDEWKSMWKSDQVRVILRSGNQYAICSLARGYLPELRKKMCRNSINLRITHITKMPELCETKCRHVKCHLKINIASIRRRHNDQKKWFLLCISVPAMSYCRSYRSTSLSNLCRISRGHFLMYTGVYLG